MDGIPLASRLKKRAHREVALAQDILVSQAFDSFPKCVLHGGTAVWRCYGGGRFSEDVDLYIPRFTEAAADKFRRGLKAKGARELKFKTTENTVFGSYELGGALTSLEGALRGAPERVICAYETLAGGRMMVATLTPAGLVAEKASAYLDRRKVRDLYDIFFLLDLVEDRERVAKGLASFVGRYSPPEDGAQLKSIIVAGAVPTVDEMIEGVRRWARRYT